MAGDETRSVFDWENFPSSNSSVSPSASRLRKIELKEWSMVVITDSRPNNDFSVFPPSNHENLHCPSNEEDERGSPVSFQSNSPSTSFRSSQSSSSFSSFSFSDDETSHSHSPKPSDCQIRKSMAASRWMVYGVQILRARITAMASTIWSNTARRTAFWLFSPAGRIALVVTLWWLYKRARQRRLRQSSEQLRMIIKEKDKVCQLLISKCL